jgi:hypothetical protein
MADSYPTADVGAVADFPRFPFDPNWAEMPQTKLTLLKRILQHRGTSHELTSLTDEVPIGFEAGFTLFTRADYNTMLDFFVDARGRANRFWVKHPRRHFKLKVAASNGDSQIKCYDNNFHNQYQGEERLYIIMNDGDVLARHITAASYDSGNDWLLLSLNTQLDRDISLTNHVIIGRYLLARFDDDEWTYTAQTDTVIEFSFNFMELVREYDEI